MRFQKTRKKMHGISTWHETLNLVTILVLNRIFPILSFSKCFQPIIVAKMCTLARNVFKFGPFNPQSFNISHPYLIKFHDFADNIQERMKHQMKGATHTQ